MIAALIAADLVAIGTPSAVWARAATAVSTPATESVTSCSRPASGPAPGAVASRPARDSICSRLVTNMVAASKPWASIRGICAASNPGRSRSPRLTSPNSFAVTGKNCLMSKAGPPAK